MPSLKADMSSNTTRQENSDPAPTEDLKSPAFNDEDGIQNYIAMAVPLLHVLRQSDTSRAKAIAQRMMQRWGGGSGVAGGVLKVLEECDSGPSEDDTESSVSDSNNSSSVESGAGSSGASSDGGVCDGGDMMCDMGSFEKIQELVHCVEKLLPNASTGTEPGEKDVVPEGFADEEEDETEEERQILKQIEVAVEREMDRLSIIRKHR
uniref:WGS project CAEQ00000000 data, annotated contig 1152 n=1 Tax=Trypanosoma congolense (strain IL3000) TaxID=1068625 RepID=F9W468_TRYCI|nr:unnamed protein product [Trypanosoma congolense IL3000]